MTKSAKSKILVHQKLGEILDGKIEEASLAIASVKESRDNETKSSAGDKHETARAMMQIEMVQNEEQLSKAIHLQNEYSKIKLEKEYNKVEMGSLVFTNHENYFISVGIGKIVIENEIFYAVSLASPIGMFLKDKKPGDKGNFQGRDFVLIDIC